jgi:hypothetical protein
LEETKPDRTKPIPRIMEPRTTTIRGPYLSLALPAKKVVIPKTRAQMEKAREMSALDQPNSAFRGLMNTLQA